jgi:hypothetical protein
MSRRRAQVALRTGLLATAAIVAAGCFYSKKNEFEDWNPAVPGTRYKTIATIAGTSSGPAIRLTVQLRQQLKEGGWNPVPRSGRWDNAAEAVNGVCAPGAEEPVDGVLIVAYNHLTLYDCQTLKTVYEIGSSPEGGGMGLKEMTNHLIRYLQGKSAKPTG